MQRNLFTEDHEAFRELARDFVEKEVVPAYPYGPWGPAWGPGWGWGWRGGWW